MTLKQVAVLAALLLGTVAPDGAWAMTAAGGVEQLGVGANLIARGRVQQVVSRWTADRSAIYTDVTLAVDQFAKNGLQGKPNRNITPSVRDGRGQVVFRLPGGEVGNIAMTAADMAIPRVGEELVVLLAPAEATGSGAGLGADAETLAPVGQAQGWYPIHGGKVVFEGHELGADEFMAILAGPVRP